jgi:hypothetical protein
MHVITMHTIIYHYIIIIKEYYACHTGKRQPLLHVRIKDAGIQLFKNSFFAI